MRNVKRREVLLVGKKIHYGESAYQPPEKSLRIGKETGNLRGKRIEFGNGSKPIPVYQEKPRCRERKTKRIGKFARLLIPITPAHAMPNRKTNQAENTRKYSRLKRDIFPHAESVRLCLKQVPIRKSEEKKPRKNEREQ